MFDIFASDVQTTSKFSEAADRIQKLCEQSKHETATEYYSHCETVRSSLTAPLGSEPTIQEFGSQHGQGG